MALKLSSVISDPVGRPADTIMKVAASLYLHGTADAQEAMHGCEVECERRLTLGHLILTVLIAFVAVCASIACSDASPTTAGNGGDVADVSASVPNSSDLVAITTSPTNDSAGENLAVFFYDASHQRPFVPDPVARSSGNAFFAHEVYSGLLRPSRAAPSQLEPDLAERFDLSEDGLNVTFTLRDGLKFSDGSPVSASDFKWSWERALAPETRSAGAPEVLGAIVGADVVASGEATELSGFSIADDSTFSVELRQRHASFLWSMADPVASVLKPSNASLWAEGVDWAGGQFLPTLPELPVGTGPFRVSALALLDGFVTLERNPHYWDIAPCLDAVKYVGIASDALDAQINKWLDGTSDFEDIPNRFCEDGDGSDDIITVDGLPASLMRLETPPRVAYLAFNPAVAPFDDVDFRRALVKSADSAMLGGLFDVVLPNLPATGLLPPNFAGHDATRELPVPDREAALDSLAKSQYADITDTIQLRFIPDQTGLAQDDFDNITSNWRDWLGVDAAFSDRPISTWLDEFNNGLEDGSLQMRFVLVRPLHPSPDAILGAIPRLFGPAAQSDETQELQQMLDSAAAQTDSVERLAMYQEIERRVLHRAMVLPIDWDTGGMCHGVQEWVSNFKVPKYGGSVFLTAEVNTEHPRYPERSPYE